MFYQFNQNNSFGRFEVDDKVCHRLFIEADSSEEAISKAEELGCYWNGVAEGIDCPCCGDRWNTYYNKIDIDKWKIEGYKVEIYDGIYNDTIQEWEKRYGKFTIVEKPHFETHKYIGSRSYVGYISFASIEEYAQFLADEYGWTVPDARIFYKDKTVKEIYSKRS